MIIHPEVVVVGWHWKVVEVMKQDWVGGHPGSSRLITRYLHSKHADKITKTKQWY